MLKNYIEKQINFIKKELKFINNDLFKKLTR